MIARRLAVAAALACILPLAGCVGAPDPAALAERIEERVPDVTAEVSLRSSSPFSSTLSVLLLDVADGAVTADELSEVTAALLSEPLDGVGRVSVGAYSAPGECVDLGSAIDGIGLAAFAFDRNGAEECTSLTINRTDLEEWEADR